MIRTGTDVRWNWGNGTATGTVQDVRHEKTSIQSKGETITRDGTDDDPALIIEQEDGTRVLKLSSEVERTNA
jgi:metal-dependent hydrolase (beta-lactamase superfamily II)